MTTTQPRLSANIGDREPAYRSGLLRLVDDLDRLAAAWEREPLVTTGLAPVTDIFSTAAAQRLLPGLPLSAIRLFNHGERYPDERFARPLDHNARSRQRYPDAGRVAQALAEGATLVLEELQTFSSEVAEFAALLAQQTGYRTDCTAFLTPANSRGLNPHTDPVSVFLLQVEGSKRWRISRGRQRWPHAGWRPGDERGAAEVLDVVLRAGDCLYLPRGFIHVGQTTDEASVHLSISVSTDTWASILQEALFTAAVRTELLREMPPPLFDPSDREQLFRERRELLARALATLQHRDLVAALPSRTRGVVSDPNVIAEALHGADRRMELT
jgi:bifunctional lysine-specific demethylase and histidyl-hydroxylase NO66